MTTLMEDFEMVEPDKNSVVAAGANQRVADTERLLPCPFCGQPPAIGGTLNTRIHCVNDQCIIYGGDTGGPLPFNGYGHRESAVAAWNRRTHLAQQAPAEQTPVCAEAIAYEQACLFILSLGYHWSDAEETWVKTASPVAEQRPETREEKK
jgi:hypothetical protein